MAKKVFKFLLNYTAGSDIYTIEGDEASGDRHDGITIYRGGEVVAYVADFTVFEVREKEED